MTSWANLHDIMQLTKHGTVNTRNRNPLLGDDANVSWVPTEPLFTPVRRRRAAEKSIFTEKRISRESEVYLQYLIINQHVSTSPIEKSRPFWSRKDTPCRQALEGRQRPRPHRELAKNERSEVRDHGQGVISHPLFHVRRYQIHARVNHGQNP